VVLFVENVFKEYSWSACLGQWVYREKYISDFFWGSSQITPLVRAWPAMIVETQGQLSLSKSSLDITQGNLFLGLMMNKMSICVDCLD
jgi:hypothetical protein